MAQKYWVDCQRGSERESRGPIFSDHRPPERSGVIELSLGRVVMSNQVKERLIEVTDIVVAGGGWT